VGDRLYFETGTTAEEPYVFRYSPEECGRIPPPGVAPRQKRRKPRKQRRRKGRLIRYGSREERGDAR